MKKYLVFCLFFIAVCLSACAQKVAFLTPDRIEVEIINDEIIALNKEDAEYKNSLEKLQGLKATADKKATEMEAILMQAILLESTSKTGTITFKTTNNSSVEWVYAGSKTSVIKVPVRPPGGEPCGPGGACLDFLYLITEACPNCNFSSFETLRKFTVDKTTYTIYIVPVKGLAENPLKTITHIIAATTYARR